MADCRAVQIQELRDDEMIKENDKDAIIKHLLETLDKVNDMLDSLLLYDYNDNVDKIRDYIWHRKTDVTF